MPAPSNAWDGMPWVLIDLSWLAHRARYAMGDLSFEDEPTGIIYGVLEQLRTICFDPMVRSSRLMIFADDSKHSVRREFFPDYKRKRHVTLSEQDLRERAVFRDQVELLVTQVLPTIGITVWRQAGLESDDGIAYAASVVRSGVMITADNDLYQCIRENVHWYDPLRRKYFRPDTFATLYGIAPERWGQVKELAGCRGDCVPGVPGVGEVTAVRYLRGVFPASSKRHKAIVNSTQLRQRNAQLVRLPHVATLPFAPCEPAYSWADFSYVCKQYGIESYDSGSKRSQWEDIMRGTVCVEDRQPKRRRASNANRA